MTEHSIADDVVYLITCAVRGETPDKKRVRASDIDGIYRFASRHSVKAAVAYAIESSGLKDERSAQIIASSLRKTLVFDKAWEEIKKRFDGNGIWYVPLKGAALKGEYPKFGMREFCDYDILIDPERAADVKDIMESLGYTAKYYNVSVHDVYLKKPFLVFEKHRSLFNKDYDGLFGYYRDVERRFIGDGYEKRFSPEDFYLFSVAHAFKHFSERGTGLRILLDTYVCLKKGLDTDYISAEAEKMGISDFELTVRRLATHLFEDDELTDSERETLDYILSSGTYGTISHEVENGIRKRKGSKVRYALGRIFVPVNKKNPSYEKYERAYPFFYRHKAFLPALPFVRFRNSVKRGRFKAEFKALRKAKR